jgi:hypothetical protein
VKKMSKWTQALAAIFAVAILHGSFCGTICSAGFCGQISQPTAGHECQPSGSNHSHHSGAPGQQNQECSSHAHPEALALKPVPAPNVHLRASGHDQTAAIKAVLYVSRMTRPDGIAGLDHGPRRPPGMPLFQQNSLLRI